MNKNSQDQNPSEGRYHRQILMDEIGSKGQEKLARSCVLIAGAGGLGSISSMYLAAAGVGHIILADPDQVSLSNLNRQLLYTESVLGQPKAVSAARRLGRLNSAIRITPVQETLGHGNIHDFLDGVDLMVDGSDNYETRQVLNQAALKSKIPWVFGGVSGLDGMTTVFNPHGTNGPTGPCFECLFPMPGPPKTSGAILGATAGVIGSIQAMEAVKQLLGMGNSLAGRLMRFSGLSMRTTTAVLDQNPDCRICHTTL